MKPVIFLAFANDKDDNARYLRNLPVELDGLRKALKPLEDRGLYRIIERANCTAEQIFEIFRENKVHIFHYGGHADGYQFLLETLPTLTVVEDPVSGLNKTAYANGLVSLFANHGHLKLVFFNGCTTEQQGRELASAGLPAVIYTDNTIKDDISTDLSIHFYQNLGQKKTIAESWETAKQYIKTKYNTQVQGGLFRKGVTPTVSFPWQVEFTKEGRAWFAGQNREWAVDFTEDSLIFTSLKEEGKKLTIKENEHYEIYKFCSSFLKKYDIIEFPTIPTIAEENIIIKQISAQKDKLIMEISAQKDKELGEVQTREKKILEEKRQLEQRFKEYQEKNQDTTALQAEIASKEAQINSLDEEKNRIIAKWDADRQAILAEKKVVEDKNAQNERIIAQQQQQIEELEKKLAQFKESPPTEVSEAYRQAMISFEKGQLQAALDILNSEERAKERAEEEAKAQANYQKEERNLREKHYKPLAQEDLLNANLNVSKGNRGEAEKLYKKSYQTFAYYENTFEYAKFLQDIREYQQAIDLYQESLQYTENEEQKVKTLLYLGYVYDETNQIILAFEYYEKAKNMYEKVPKKYSKDLAGTYNNLGNLYDSQGKYAQAEEYYLQAKQLYESDSTTLPKDLAGTYNNLGLLYANQGKYAQAEEHYLQAKQLYESYSTTLPKALAHTYNNLGSLYYQQGKYAQAEEYYLQAKQLYESDSTTLPKALAGTCNNLGLLYADQGKYAQAEEHYLQAKELYEKDENTPPQRLADTYHNLGMLYADQGKYAQAEEFYLKAKELYEQDETTLPKDLAGTYLNLGVLYADQGKYAQAEEHYLQAKQLKESDSTTLPKELAGTYLNLGVLYYYQSKYAQAEGYAVLAMQTLVQVEEADAESMQIKGTVADLKAALNSRLHLDLREEEKPQKVEKKALTAEDHFREAQHLEKEGRDIEKIIAHYSACIEAWSVLPLSENEDADWYAQALLSRGKCYASVNNNYRQEKAIADFEQAQSVCLALLPTDASVLLIYVEAIYQHIKEIHKDFSSTSWLNFTLGKEKKQIRALRTQAQEISKQYTLTDKAKVWLEKIAQEFGKV